MPKHVSVAFALVLLGLAFDAAAIETPTPVMSAPAPAITLSPWDATFAQFAADDLSHPPPAGGILFVGSSSIRLWSDLEAQFKDLPVVIKRGFGGSQLSDCVKHLNRLVVRYHPRLVLVYAGDNDLAAGSSPEEVLRRLAAFVDGVHSELADTRIAYIAIKPSPSRVGLLTKIRDTNNLIRDYAAAQGKVDFIDVYTPMLDAAGKPRPELFLADALHLNSDGYALWKRVIAPHVH
jgi:lysophospholipase L1-like esterase